MSSIKGSKRVAGAIAILVGNGLLLGACGDTEEVPAPDRLTPRAGSRLKVIWWQAGEQRRAIGWYDPQLDAECRFVRVGDEFRCLPEQAELVYTDASCTQPLATDVEGPGWYSLREYGTDYCDPQVSAELIRVGSKVARPTTVFRGSDCSPTETSQESTYYNLTERTSIDGTVAATLSSQPLDDRMSRDLLTAADGSTEFLSLFDRELDTYVFSLADSFVPIIGAETTDAYSDASCGVPVGKVVPEYCNVTFTADSGAQSTDRCDSRWQYYRVGPRVTNQVYERTFSGCEALPTETAEVGEAIPWEALLVDSRIITGQGRIRARMHASAESGTPLEHDAWYDTRWGTACDHGIAPDGRARCLPIGFRNVRWTDGRVFTDRECKVPAVPVDACGQDIRIAWDGNSKERYRVTGTRTIDESYELNAGVCVATKLPREVYSLERIDPSEFVEVKELIE